MKDAIGRLWKVKDGRFLCYEKKGDGNIKELALIDMAAPYGKHQGHGKGCGGEVYGAHNFYLCGKCAAEVMR